MLIVFAVLLVAAGVAVGRWALDFDAIISSPGPDPGPAPRDRPPARAPKVLPSDGVFAIDLAAVSAVDYESTRRSWTAERMDGGAEFAVTMSDVLGRVAGHCRADLEPVINGLAMVRVERLLPTEEAQNLWALRGPVAAKVRLRGPDMEDSIEFRVVFTEHIREAVVLRANGHMFVPSVPAEVFELLAEGCPRKNAGEDEER
jgi:hypothetical protein